MNLTIKELIRDSHQISKDSHIFWLIFSEVKAIGFEAAICIDNCFPNKSISFDILFEVKDTITANLETLSLITEC